MKTNKTVKSLWLLWILALGWLFSFWITYWGNYFDELSKSTATAKNASKKNIVQGVSGFCNIMIKELDEVNHFLWHHCVIIEKKLKMKSFLKKLMN